MFYNENNEKDANSSRPFSFYKGGHNRPQDGNGGHFNAGDFLNARVSSIKWKQHRFAIELHVRYLVQASVQ